MGLLLGVAVGAVSVFLVLALAGLLCAGLLDFLITQRGQARQVEIERQLPDLFDRLKITIEAGLGFDSALANCIAGRNGPVYDEFRRILQDLQLGVARDEALQALANRTSVVDLRIILAAIIQSSKYGLPLAEVLRVQTEELRDKRWQRAQERALKIPVKLLFPVLLCILPMFFLVLLYPNFVLLTERI